MSARRKIRIGDLLVDNGLINDEQLTFALQEQKKSGRKLGHTLVDLGYVSENELLRLLARQLNIDVVDRLQFLPDQEELSEGNKLIKCKILTNG